jgi:hypothetical protein
MHQQNKPKKRDKKMIEALLLVGGIILGGGAVALLGNKKPTDDKTSQTQQEVIKQLTDLDMIKELCHPDKIKTAEGLLTCRELTCLVYTRGIDSQTSGKTCEEISNMQNSIMIMEYCKDRFEDKTDCYDVFWRRK